MSLKKVIARTLFVCLLLAVLGLLVHAFLPLAGEHLANHFLSDYADNGELAVEIQRITPTGMDLAFSACPADEEKFGPQASYASCTIRYTPGNLLKKHVDSVSIHGVHFPMDFTDGEIELPLLSVLKETEAATGTARQGMGGFRLNDIPVTVGRLDVSGNAVMTLPNRPGDPPEEVVVPIHFQLESNPDNPDLLRYTLTLQNSANSLDAQGVLHWNENIIEGTTKIKADVRMLPHFIREFLPEGVEVFANVTAKYRFRLEDEFPESFSVQGSFNIAADFGGVSVNCTPEITIEGNPEKVTASVHGLKARTGNLPLALKASCVWENAARRLTGTLMPKLGENFTMPIEFLLEPAGENWHLEFHTAAEKDAASRELFGIAFDAMPMVNFDAILKQSDLDYKADLKLPRVQTTLAGTHFSLDSLELRANGTAYQCLASAVLKEFRIDAPICKAEVPETVLDYKFKSLNDWGGGIRIGNARTDFPKLDLALHSMSAEFPFTQDGGTGKVSLGEIRYKERPVGAISCNILWQGTPALQLADGAFTLCRLKGEFEAGAEWGENDFNYRVTLDVPRQELTDNLGLTELFPDVMDDKEIGGEAELHAVWEYKNEMPQGSASLALHNVSVASEKMGFHITGIYTKFELPHLPIMVSKPNQFFAFREIVSGPLTAGPGVINYRMDAPDNWCIERLKVNWCQGAVRMESTYFSPEAKRMNFTIHCDRLDLVDFLNQTGLGTGTGNGNGRITGTLPITFLRDKSTISVRDGFLYTTPGEEGNIKLELSDAVMKAAPGVMMELSQAALRDFSYSWAKIGVETKDDTLAIALQLDGKPNQPLYYTYQNGAFAQTKVPHIFQGIQLDANFNVPCSELFYLYNQWNELKDSSKEGE